MKHQEWDPTLSSHIRSHIIDALDLEIGINLVLILSDYIAMHYWATFAFPVQTILIEPHCAQKEEKRKMCNIYLLLSYIHLQKWICPFQIYENIFDLCFDEVAPLELPSMEGWCLLWIGQTSEDGIYGSKFKALSSWFFKLSRESLNYFLQQKYELVYIYCTNSYLCCQINY